MISGTSDVIVVALSPPARLGAWGTGREVTRGWTWNTPCLTHPATGLPSLPAHVASWPDSYLLSHGHIQTMSPGHTSGPCRVGPGVATAWHWTALECSEGLPSEPAWPSTSPGAPTHILNYALAALSHDYQPVHPKGNQPWVFIGRTDAEAQRREYLAWKVLIHQ